MARRSGQKSMIVGDFVVSAVGLKIIRSPMNLKSKNVVVNVRNFKTLLLKEP